jgi:hypothetical protein
MLPSALSATSMPRGRTLRPLQRRRCGLESSPTGRSPGRAPLWNSPSAHAAAPHPVRRSSAGESGAAGWGPGLAELRDSSPPAPRADLCPESSGPGLHALPRSPGGAAAAPAPAARASAGPSGGWGTGCPEPLGSPGGRTAVPGPLPCESPRLRSPAGCGGRAGRVRRALFPPAAGLEPFVSHACLSTAAAPACAGKLSAPVGDPMAAGACGADADCSAGRVCLIQRTATGLDCRAPAHAGGAQPALAPGSLPVSCSLAGELGGSAASLRLGEQAAAAALEPADGPDALGPSGLCSAGSGAAHHATASPRITHSESCTAGIGPCSMVAPSDPCSTPPPSDPCSRSGAWGTRIRREPLRPLLARSVQAPDQICVWGGQCGLCSAATGLGHERCDIAAMGNQHRASASVPENLSTGMAAGAAMGLAAGRTNAMLRSHHTQARAAAAASADGALACARRGRGRCGALCMPALPPKRAHHHMRCMGHGSCVRLWLPCRPCVARQP